MSKLAAALLAALPLAAGAAGPLSFERLGAEDGLPSLTAPAVLVDRDGFVWIATRDGLAMWDGHAMRVFQHDAADPASLPDNAVRAVHEDREGRLWVATNTGGLALLDRGAWRFEVFRHAAADPASLSSDTVFALADAAGGGLWVGTLDGLDRWDPATRTFEHVLPAAGEPSLRIMYVHEDARGRLWAASFGAGLGVREPATRRFRWYRHDDAVPGSLCSDDVLVVESDAAGRLWVGTHEGLDRFDEAAGVFRHADLAPTGGPKVLVTAIVPGERGALWVGTMGRGLLELPASGGPVVAHREDPSSRRALPHDSVMGVALEGRDLWIATWGGGVAHARLGGSLPHGPGRPHGEASDDDLQSVLEGDGGTIWAASWGGGLVEYPPGKPPVRHLFEPSSKGSGTMHVSRDARGRLWVGAMDRLWRLDPRTGRSDAIRHVPGDPGSLPAGYVTATLEDRDGRRWVGLGPGGVVRLAPDGRTVEAHLGTETPPPSRLADGFVTALLQDSRGTLWVGTRNGLHAVDPATGVVTVIPSRKDRRWSLPDATVNCLLEDSKRRLWIGTGGGLSLLQRGPAAEPTFEHLTWRDGLVDDEVTALVEDDDGSLWVATRGGLSRFDPEARVFASFDASDGLGSIEFNQGAAARSRTALLFGTRRGLLELPRGSPFPQRQQSRTVITAIRTPEGEIRAREPVWRLGALEVPYGRWLSVEMAVLDYRPRHRHRFAYRLRDGDPWVDLGSRREVTFADLPPGEYRLAVRGRDARGAWSEARQPLALRVVPPYWMTWAFRVPLGLGLAALALWALLARLRRLERRNKQLVALRDEREAAYERLRQLTLHLEAVREDERRWIARELHDEMGQELTAAKINLQLLGRGAGQPLPAQGLAETVQLLDRLIARVRSLSLDLRPPLLDDRGLRPALEGWLDAVGRRSGLATRLTVLGEVGRLSPDLEIAGFRVVQEAVTNALRHAAARALDVSLERHGGRLRLEVRDDGAGFDVAEALARSAGGDHLGLVGMRQRVEMLGGGLEIASAAGEGTSVRAWLPLEVRT